VAEDELWLLPNAGVKIPYSFISLLTPTGGMKRSATSNEGPSKRCNTRVYQSTVRAGTLDTTRRSRYTQIRNNNGRLQQRRTVQQTITPVIPELDPDDEIDQWVDDHDESNDTTPAHASNASTSSANVTQARVPKQKKTQTRLVRVFSYH
jgi:hypothetical protein